MSKPLVSIAIVAYNQEDFVEAALDGALSQSWPNLEVVAADDGSTDRTLEIFERWAARHRQVKVVGGPNGGITANCNRALAGCSGEFLTFQGGDDILLPRKVEAQVDWLEHSPERVLCGHDVEHFLSDTGECIALQSQLTPPRAGRGAEQFIANGPAFAAISVMVRRGCLPSYGFDARLPAVSDGKLWIDCLLAGGEFGYLPEVLARYRRHSASITVGSRQNCLVEEHLTLSLLEAERPDLAAVCARGRARLHRREGVLALMRGEMQSARQELRGAVIAAPYASLKTPLWLALSYVPDAMRDTLLVLARRVNGARLARAARRPLA